MSQYLTVEERMMKLRERQKVDRYWNLNRKSFLRSSPKLGGIRDILELCLSEKSFTTLCKKSKIAHKMTFLKYVNWCVSHGMIKKEPHRYKMIYLITPKGRRFLQDTSDDA